MTATDWLASAVMSMMAGWHWTRPRSGRVAFSSPGPILALIVGRGAEWDEYGRLEVERAQLPVAFTPKGMGLGAAVGGGVSLSVEAPGADSEAVPSELGCGRTEDPEDLEGADEGRWVPREPEREGRKRVERAAEEARGEVEVNAADAEAGEAVSCATTGAAARARDVSLCSGLRDMAGGG